MSEWKPIETAPLKQWLLVHGSSSRTSATFMVVRRIDENELESADDGYEPYIEPTHWMPLPEPPKS